MSEIHAEGEPAKIIHIDDWTQRLALKQQLAVSSLIERLESAPFLMTESFWNEVSGDIALVREAFGHTTCNTAYDRAQEAIAREMSDV